MSVAPWTELDPLKRTAALNFTQGRLAKGASNAEARDILRELTGARNKMLSVMSRVKNKPEDVQEATQSYISLLRGLIEPPPASLSSDTGLSTDTVTNDASGDDGVRSGSGGGDAAASSAVSPASALRLARAILFKWTDNTSGKTESEADARFELASVQLQLALWHATHAAELADEEQRVPAETDDNAKEIYKSLQFASGVMTYLLEERRARAAYTPGTDLDERYLAAVAAQYLCEAQEVTVERARAKGHTPHLIAGVASDTHTRFEKAVALLATAEAGSLRPLRVYLQFKSRFYAAYALTYTGLDLFAAEKCGEALKAFAQASAALVEAEKLSREFKKVRSRRWAVVSAGPQTLADHKVYTELTKTLTAGQDKARRENDFIYRHKVPDEPVAMPEPKGLAQPLEFVPAPLDRTWDAAKFAPSKVPQRGEDIAADVAAADDAKVSKSALHPDEAGREKRATDLYCVLQ